MKGACLVFYCTKKGRRWPLILCQAHRELDNSLACASSRVCTSSLWCWGDNAGNYHIYDVKDRISMCVFIHVFLPGLGCLKIIAGLITGEIIRLLWLDYQKIINSHLLLLLYINICLLWSFKNGGLENLHTHTHTHTDTHTYIYIYMLLIWWVPNITLNW